MKELCDWLGIEKLRTSPYHPETNGAVERMHGTFKGILGKCMEERLDWVGQGREVYQGRTCKLFEAV